MNIFAITALALGFFVVTAGDSYARVYDRAEYGTQMMSGRDTCLPSFQQYKKDTFICPADEARGTEEHRVYMPTNNHFGDPTSKINW